MKKLLIMFAFVGLGVFTSCSKDETSGSGEALALTADALTHYTGEGFTFTVKSKSGADVSSKSTILVNDAPIVGNVFASKTAGTYTVKATNADATTKSIEIIVTENPVALVSIATTPSAASAVTGDKVSFTVAGNNNSNFTSTSTIYVNDVAITGTNYTSTTAGTLNVYSTYTSADNVTVTSPTVQVTISDPINFKKRVLIEDYTGTWCGFCPRVAYAIDQVHHLTENAVSVALHSGPGGQDPFDISATAKLAKTFGVSGFPGSRLNRTTKWTYNEPDHVQQAVDLTAGENPRIGLAMNTSLSGTTATVDVKVKFGQNFSGLKLVVYAVEDKLVYDQHNYTTYYGGGDIIKDFEFNDVLRAVLTADSLGDAIEGSTNVNDEITKTFTYTIPATVKAENVHFVAFVVDSTKKALNVRNASNNENQTYEIQ